MRVIDNVKLPGFVQWCSNFVKRVILPTQLHIDGKKVDTVEIVDIDEKTHISVHLRSVIHHKNMELLSLRTGW